MSSLSQTSQTCQSPVIYLIFPAVEKTEHPGTCCAPSSFSPWTSTYSSSPYCETSVASPSTWSAWISSWIWIWIFVDLETWSDVCSDSGIVCDVDFCFAYSASGPGSGSEIFLSRATRTLCSQFLFIRRIKCDSSGGERRGELI